MASKTRKTRKPTESARYAMDDQLIVMEVGDKKVIAGMDVTCVLADNFGRHEFNVGRHHFGSRHAAVSYLLSL